MIILLSKSSLKDNYAIWLKNLHPDIHLKDAFSEGNDSPDRIIHNCSGILLTGGADINPARYGQAGETNRCENIDDARDGLELKLIAAALDNSIPLLSICRGVQIINVFFNGTLIIDIPSDYGKKVEHRNKTDVNHAVTIAKESALSGCGPSDHYIVNSSHHQAIGSLGKNLLPVAWSNDDLVEAVQLDHSISHPFFLGVQWHPERMEINHPMSGAIGMAFLQKAEEFR